MIKIHFHLGQPKTGSSSIQRVLKKNSLALREQGYLYNPSGIDHQKVFHEIKNHDDMKHFIENQIALAKEYNCDNIIISYEDLFFKKEKLLNQWFDGISDNFYAYVYLRRQDLYLESAWKQWHFKDLRFNSFDDYVEKYKIENYYEHLQKWTKYIRKDQIKIIPFEKRNMEDGLVPGFLSAIGLENTESFNYKVDDDGWGENKGLTSEGLELAFLVRELADNNIHDHSIQHFIHQYFQDFEKEHFQNYGLIPYQKRIQIIKEYDSVNDKISKEFLGSNQKLFKDSVDISSSNSSDISVERVLKALMTIGIKQNRKIEKLAEEIRQMKAYIYQTK